MKPVNSNLGATGSFVSRVSSISSSQASIDSVVFQQGKSILDFDLNVTQDVLKNSIESLARSILSKSGFLKSIAITSSYSSPNVTISIPPVDVALLGKIVRLSSSSATGNINSTVNVSSGAFFWIELWYQEIIPEGTIETGKISVIKSYGYADDDSSLSNTMKDVTFGAETTRRVQLRWRVRSAQTTSSNFTDATITARGGNQAGVADYNFYLSNSYASSTETALGASSVKNSLLEYALLNDSGVYIAGRGTDADAQALNTVDGRVYAFSLCTVAANSSSLTNTYSLVGATTSGALSGSSATIGNLNISSEVSATTLSIVNTAANSSNIVLSPANAGFVSGPNFQLSGDGTVLVPALRFSSSTSTGLYYTSASTVPELNISTAGVQRLKINASALTVSGNIIASATNAYIQIGAGSITGLSTGESMITSLNALAFRSANVSITGGLITGSLTNSATQITGTIAAVAKTNFSFVNESVFSNTIANYTPPSVTSINASHVVTPYPRNGIVFVPGTNTTLLASYDDNYVYLQITTGTSSFETASGDSITPSTYVGKPSDSWSEGVSTRPARRDHIHKREGYATTTIGVPTSLYTTLNDSNLLGTSTAVARADHTHTLGSYIPAIGIGSARTSALTSVLEVTGLISDSAAHLTIRDSATNAANIGGKLSFAGVDYATSTTFLSYGSIGIYREAIGTNSTYASFVTRSAANLNESLRLYKNASAKISTTAADYATTPADGSIEVENGAIAKYFKASSFVISNGVSTGASRFIGSVGAKPTAITNVTVGDFVIDTTGNIHVYSGSTSGWLTAGILTTAANSWTGSQQFGANRTWADTSGLTNTASAINMSSYNITLSAAQGSDSVRTMYVGGNVVTSAASSTTSVAANKLYAITATGGASNWASAVPAGTVVAVYPTTTANTVDYFTAPAVGFTLNQSSSTVTELLPLLTASTQDINGPPSFAGYSYIINSYGLRILTKAVAANTYPISGTSAYGLQVGIPTKASVVYGIHIPTVIATNSAYAYGLHVTAPSGATNNYGIYVSSGSVVFADATASTNSTTGALQVAGGIYAGKASVFAGTVVIGSGEGTASVAGNTLRAPSAVGNNVAGASLTIAGGVSTGTGTGGSIIFQTAPAGPNGSNSNANGVAERMRILSNGSVGIGTSTPAEKLHINGNVLLENNNGYYIKRADGTALKFGSVDTISQMGIGDGNVNAIYFTSGSRFFYNLNGNYIANIGPNGLRIGDSTAPAAPLDALVYSTQIANVLRLTAQAKDYTFANGTFSAVNTGAKTIVLTIDSAETTTAAQITASCIGSAIYGTGAGFGSFTAFSALFTVTSATTISSKLVITCTWTGSPATTPSNGAVTAIIINGYRAGWGPQLLFSGMGDGRDTGAIRVLTETDGVGSNAYMAFCTIGLETFSERMRLTSTGRLGIGTTDPSATLHVVGTVAGGVAPKVFLPAQAFNLPPSNYPAFLQRDTGTTKYELQYSGTVDQVAHTTIVVPSSYSGGNITIKLYWYTATADQAISWQILAASTGNGGDPNPATVSLATINSSTNTAAKLKLETYLWTTSSGVNINTIFAGQILYLSLKRLGSTDVSSETINFHSMIIEF